MTWPPRGAIARSRSRGMAHLVVEHLQPQQVDSGLQLAPQGGVDQDEMTADSGAYVFRYEFDRG